MKRLIILLAVMILLCIGGIIFLSVTDVDVPQSKIEKDITFDNTDNAVLLPLGESAE